MVSKLKHETQDEFYYLQEVPNDKPLDPRKLEPGRDHKNVFSICDYDQLPLWTVSMVGGAIIPDHQQQS